MRDEDEDWIVEHDAVLPFIEDGVRDSFGPEAQRREATLQANRSRLVLDTLPKAGWVTEGSAKPLTSVSWHVE